MRANAPSSPVLCGVGRAGAPGVCWQKVSTTSLFISLFFHNNPIFLNTFLGRLQLFCIHHNRGTVEEQATKTILMTSCVIPSVGVQAAATARGTSAVTRAVHRALPRAAFTPKTKTQSQKFCVRGLRSRDGGVRARAAAGGNDERFPDDPNVPQDISQLLREIGDGEPPSVWEEKPPWQG